MQLSAEAARVLGSLVEKELTTPGQYPLTIAALVAACNQASNRDPVVSYDEGSVIATLDDLKGQRLVRFVLPSHGRSAVRYRHVLDETLALDGRQRAVLAVLLLRGPQTIGELRLRTDRMAAFESLAEVEHELDYLAAREEPLVSRLGRRPGQKEERWDCPLVAPTADAPGAGRALQPVLAAEPAGSDGPDGAGPAAGGGDLAAELAALRSEVGELRRELAELRDSLGG